MMRRKQLLNADYVVRIFSAKGQNRIENLGIRDNLQGRDIDIRKEKPGIAWFLNKADMLMSLSWCLNCWADKTRVVWEHTTQEGSYGTVYLFA